MRAFIWATSREARRSCDARATRPRVHACGQPARGAVRRADNRVTCGNRLRAGGKTAPVKLHRTSAAHVALALLALAACGEPSAPPAPAAAASSASPQSQAAPPAAPTEADARAFLAQLDKDLHRTVGTRSRADWVYQTNIND